MPFTIEGNVCRDGVHVSSYDLMDGATHVRTQRDAAQLLASYLVALITEGGTATYNRAYGEYKVIMPDGSTEYIRSPKEVL